MISAAFGATCETVLCNHGTAPLASAGLAGAIASGAWSTTLEMAPYLLFGLLVAGILSELITPETVERHLGSSGMASIVKASLFGIPLPLCSCGVIPVSASLRRHGASKGAVVSFLISTPQTGVDSIFVTYSLLGPVFAIFRPLAAFVSGIMGGVASEWGDSGKFETTSDSLAEISEQTCCGSQDHSSEKAGGGFLSSAGRVIKYGFGTVAADIARPLVVGILAAGAIGSLVPQGYLETLLGQGLGAKLAMMLLGIPIYVCATASVPIAAALMLKGVSPGAALVFLMTGPATNAAALTTIMRILGRTSALAYLFSVMITALVSGVLLDSLIPRFPDLRTAVGGEMLPVWLSTASAILLLAILGRHIAVSLFSGRRLKTQEKPLAQDSREAGCKCHHCDAHMEEIQQNRTFEIRVTGMSCSHCAAAVSRNLAELENVRSVEVALEQGLVTVTVSPETRDSTLMIARIIELGYQAEPLSPR